MDSDDNQEDELTKQFAPEKAKERINTLVSNYGSYTLNLTRPCKGKGESNRSNKKSCSTETPMAEQNTSMTSNRLYKEENIPLALSRKK